MKTKELSADRGMCALAEDTQLRCHAGEYDLDILVRDCNGRARVEISGHVMQTGRTFGPAAKLSVQLVAIERGALVQGCTDDLGAFEFVAPRADEWVLRVGEGKDAPCVVVWGPAADA